MKNERPKDSGLTRISKDEMNLIERPFASLQKEKDTRAIELTWEVEHPISGKTLQASWQVTGDPQLGLPTANDERVYLLLMQMSREANWQQRVFFTRQNLLERLSWGVDQRSYRMLEESFKRLNRVTITTENAFYNPKNGWFYNGGFHILDEYFIANEGPGRKKKGQEPQSFFRWSNILQQSFLDGNIRTLDLEFALSFKRPLSLRLFRYLDKKGYDGRRAYEIGLRELCEMHLGMVVEKRFESNLKASSDPAHAELVESGFLMSASYEPMKTRKGGKVCYKFARKKALTNNEDPTPSGPQLVNEPTISPRLTLEPQSAQSIQLPVEPNTPHEHTIPSERPPLLQRMIDIGVSSSVAENLFKATPAEQMELQLDCLSDREPKNPPATLVKAVRENWAPPPKYTERVQAAQSEVRAQAASQQRQRERMAQEQARREAETRMEKECEQLDEMFTKLDERTRQRIDKEATQKLGILGQSGRAQAALIAMRRTLLREMLSTVITATPNRDG